MISLRNKLILVLIIAGSNHYQNSQAILSQNSNRKSNIFSIQSLFAAIGFCYTIYSLYHFVLKYNKQVKLNDMFNKIITNNLAKNTSLPIENPFVTIKGPKDKVNHQIDLFCKQAKPYANVMLIQTPIKDSLEIFLIAFYNFYQSKNKTKDNRTIFLLPFLSENSENNENIKIEYYNIDTFSNLIEKKLNEKIELFKEELCKVQELLSNFTQFYHYKASFEDRIFNIEPTEGHLNAQENNIVKDIQNYVSFHITKNTLPLKVVITSPKFIENGLQTDALKNYIIDSSTIFLVNNHKKEKINIPKENTIFYTSHDDFR
jgi:hypothetical protein